MMTELNVRNAIVTSHVMDFNVLLEQHVRLSHTMPEERQYTKQSVRMIPKMASVPRSRAWTTVMKNAQLMVIVLEPKNVVTMDAGSLVCKRQKTHQLLTMM